jgi:hypothetical protein
MSKYIFVYTDHAIEEYDTARRHYENYGLHALGKFEGAVSSIEVLLSEFPFTAHRIDDEYDIYVRSIPGYPYALYLRIVDTDCQVIAFSMQNERQDPDLIKHLVLQRLKNPETFADKKLGNKGESNA